MLTSLPNEILINITGFLDEQKDRVHLAASCRHFRNVLLPYAFTSIFMNSDCRWTLSCLVDTLLRKPRCGAAVRSLSLIGGPCRHSRKLRFNRELLTRALQRIAHTEEELVEWRDDLEGNPTDGWGGYTEDVWRAVLLSLVPNLETLEVGWYPTQKYTEKILSKAPNHETPFDVRRAFTRLRSVSIPEWDCDDTPINACDIMNSSGLPSLQQFSGYGVADFADNDEVSRITKLGLSPTSKISPFMAATRRMDLLASCLCAKSFSHSSMRISFGVNGGSHGIRQPSLTRCCITRISSSKSMSTTLTFTSDVTRLRMSFSALYQTSLL